MIEARNHQHRLILQKIAHRVMLERGLQPDFPPQAIAELNKITSPAHITNKTTRDLRKLIWCSIDNNDSRDLDQLTYAEQLPGGDVKIYVAIADVDALVKRQTALDEHARLNTTSVYTAGEIFPMLPEKLSTDFTSLGFEDERMAVVIEMVVAKDGSVKDSDIYSAMVRNYAKLAYQKVANWLDGIGEIPGSIRMVKHLEENVKLQDLTAQRLKELRHTHGALNLETLKATPVFVDDQITDLVDDKTNRAKDIIADFMIAANGVSARYLAARQFPSLRRVVRTPKRWERIVELAAEHKFKLPVEPDSIALNKFLMSARAADPERFPDLSLSVIKLMGPGEYVVFVPGEDSIGHFGLAVKDYTHSTAPNRRFPDIITQRLLKAAIAGKANPYTTDELQAIALHCTKAADDVNKVERQVDKSAAAILLESRIGQKFDGVVTGAAEKGTYVRIFHPPVEGRIVSGSTGIDVGNRVRVQLVSTDVEQGYIDFRKSN